MLLYGDTYYFILRRGIEIRKAVGADWVYISWTLIHTKNFYFWTRHSSSPRNFCRYSYLRPEFKQQECEWQKFPGDVECPCQKKIRVGFRLRFMYRLSPPITFCVPSLSAKHGGNWQDGFRIYFQNIKKRHPISS